MRAAGSTLSKLGRRIVLQFMLAVTLPLVALGLLTHSALQAQASAQAQREFDTEVSGEAMTVFGRLLAARAALQLLAQADPRDLPPGLPSSVFRTITTVDGPDDRPSNGASPNVEQLALQRWWMSAARPAQQALHWSAESPGTAARVVLAVRLVPGGTRWIAEISPDYLWADTFDVAAANRACARDDQGRPLYCTGLAGPARLKEEGPVITASKALFLEKEFGTSDWTFSAQQARSDEDSLGFYTSGMVFKVVVAALLLVLALSLMQVRRTMKPLQRLLAVTRRLARQEYAARVELSGDDEFRELGESFNDMAAQMQAHDRQLAHQATHDSLTGLHNRAGLHEALHTAVTTGRRFALLFADLDRFKTINDTMGHHAGDEVLRLAAQRLRAAIPGALLIARPGGDEFVLLLDGEDAAEQASSVAATICSALSASFNIGEREVVLGASVGWALFPDDGSDASEVMRHADMAMYAAKDRGRGQATRFAPQMDLAAAQHAWIVSDLRLAVARRQLVLHYQPRVDASSGIADTAEALVRWQHPTRGLVPPALFIETAEQIGFIQELGQWVLREACRQVAQWRRDGVPIECVSVNLSALQLADAGLFDQVVAALAEHDLSPAHLELEVTESVFVGDQTVVAALLARLRSLGIAIALDDFGTGYSSMAYLSKLPVDVMKVDRAFVKDLGQDRTADTVTRAIVTLAHSLELGLVAEGVETLEQAEMLKAMGCQQLQGYFYSRPVPADQYPQLACVGRVRAQQLAEA